LRVALATCARIPRLTEDDRRLQEELRRDGTEAVAAVWDDPAVPWSRFDRVVVRSCWDYHVRLPEFLAWVEALERQHVALWNPAPLLRSNAHKSYLRDLASRGLPLVPTVWLSRGARDRLADVLDERGWAEVVVKPAVSASAFRTWRVSRREAEGAEARREFEHLIAAGDLLVQRFVPEIVTPGEWSFVFLGEAYSHAVLKRPAAGDFRVQEEYGGRIAGGAPSAALVAQAERIAAWIPRPWLYARIDVVEIAGTLNVMEVELIEPALFLGSNPSAPARFADVVRRAVR
jgi:glutathione synthase/RimK-type ligase-like ATP-grasp enzyme